MSEKSKLTLIVDGNWLLMSRYAVLGYVTDSAELMKEIKLMMARSISIVLRTFPSIDNIIFASDGGSWRNLEKIPLFLQQDNITYKGNREKSPDVDWDAIFKAYEDFIELLSEKGITTLREKGIEGDDWAWYVSQKLNKEGTNCIIWTKDHDLTQLVKTDDNGCFTAWWNSSNGLWIEDKNENEMDFLFNMQYSENERIMNELRSKSKAVVPITPGKTCIDKIIRGDAGDNIFPILLRRAKNPNSDKKFNVAVKDIDWNLDINDENAVRNYIKNLMESDSYRGRMLYDRTLDDLIEHFNYNKKLVVLNESIYPQHVLDIMSAYKVFNICKNIDEITQRLYAEKNSNVDLFESI